MRVLLRIGDSTYQCQFQFISRTAERGLDMPEVMSKGADRRNEIIVLEMTFEALEENVTFNRNHTTP